MIGTEDVFFFGLDEHVMVAERGNKREAASDFHLIWS